MKTVFEKFSIPGNIYLEIAAIWGATILFVLYHILKAHYVKLKHTEIYIYSMRTAHFYTAYRSICATQTLQVSNCIVNKGLHIIYMPVNPVKSLAKCPSPVFSPTNCYIDGHKFCVLKLSYLTLPFPLKSANKAI